MARRIQLENLTRDVLHIPVANGEFLVLGDKADTDDNVPASGRDERLQPKPVRVFSETAWENLGPLAQEVIADQVAQRRLRRVELA